MICKECQVEKEESQFLKVKHLDPEICIKCHHLKKMEKTENKEIKDKPEKLCLICSKKLEGRRWRFCSSKCSKEHDKNVKPKHWYQRITAPSNPWGSYKL